MLPLIFSAYASLHPPPPEIAVYIILPEYGGRPIVRLQVLPLWPMIWW
jgi:hypothetical protein